MNPPLWNDVLSHLVRFVQRLRRAGLCVGIPNLGDAYRSLLLVDLTDRDAFRLALRANLVHRREDLATFDQLFEEFWSAAHLGEELGEAIALGRNAATRPDLTFDPPEAAAVREDTAAGPPTTPYSPREVFWPREVGPARGQGVGPAERVAEVRRLLATIPGGIASRRAGTPGRFDLGTTLRDARRAGGEPIRLRWRDRPARKPALIMAADVSGSMERYLAEVIELLLAAGRLPGRVELFAFSTRLERLTPLVRGVRWELGRRRLAALAPRWSGGTRIGECLARLRAGLPEVAGSHGSTLVIVSDGWDRGDPDLVGREMRRLRERCRATLWVNPLLDRPDYEPRSPAMLAALPTVDRFLSLPGFRAALASVGAAEPSIRRAG